MQPVFVRIFQHQHPADQGWNGQLCGDTKQRTVSFDAGNFSRRPAATRVIVIPMRVQEQQEFLNPIEAD